jgi:TraM recognition site of TraD and TraG
MSSPVTPRSATLPPTAGGRTFHLPVRGSGDGGVYSTAADIPRDVGGVVRRADRLDRLGRGDGAPAQRYAGRVHAPASEQERLCPLFELLVSVVIYNAEHWPPPKPDGMLDPRLFVCLDEAGNCAAIKKLPQLATTGRGQGIQLLTIGDPGLWLASDVA